MNELPEVSDGMVRVDKVRVDHNPDQRGNVWFLVSLERARYVKRFNLSPGEAAELIAKLGPMLSEGQ